MSNKSVDYFAAQAGLPPVVGKSKTNLNAIAHRTQSGCCLITIAKPVAVPNTGQSSTKRKTAWSALEHSFLCKYAHLS